MVKLTTQAQNLGTPVVGITSYLKNPIEDLADYHFVAVAADSPISSGSDSSVISQLTVANAIYETIFTRSEAVQARIKLSTDAVVHKHL